MLLGAARRLSTGRATGVDIWQAKDQSANTPDGAMDNARVEGVADRVCVQTADMRTLPFTDGAFDVVLSHWAVHNISEEEGRRLALSEMACVLKPGGRLILTDIENRKANADLLPALGFAVQRLIVSAVKDAILNIVTIGSFWPATILALKGAG